VHQEVQHVSIELLRVLKKREVAHLRFDEGPATRDMVGHKQRVVALDCLIVISVDDPGGYLNPGKIVRGPMRLRFPHFGDLSEERIVFGRRGRELIIFRFARAMWSRITGVPWPMWLLSKRRIESDRVNC